MPVANYEQYCSMLDRAKKQGFAYPAINVTSTSTASTQQSKHLPIKSVMESFKYPPEAVNLPQVKV